MPLLSEDPEILAALDPTNKQIPIVFEDPVEMLYCLYRPVREKMIELHDWQIQEMVRIATFPCDNKTPLEYLLSANNGSGKDSYIIAPIAIFLALCKLRSRTIITSASYQQLSMQTESYIRTIATQANEYLRENLAIENAFLLKKEHIICRLTGSEIILFVTDDAGRAEGYHPFPDYPDGQVTIILNEAKTVPDFIAESLSRCTYRRWLEISSPGKTAGFHYKHARGSRMFPEPQVRGERYARRITSYDCPHISRAKIESDKKEMGENSALFRSKHLALFTSLAEQVVITKESIEQALLFTPAKLELKIGRRAGLDLAKGGDENVLVVVDNNEVIGMECFHAKDTAEVTVPVLSDFFKKWKLSGDNIYADDGGVGAAIIDNLRRVGWNINRVLNQSSPSAKGQYGNRGAELWFRFSLFAHLIVYPKDDDKLMTQLTNRYYKQHATQGKLILEAKSDARAKGHGSPDRADALVLAYTGVTIHDFLEAQGLAPKVEKAKRTGAITQTEIVDAMWGAKERMKLWEVEKEVGNVRLNPVNLLRSLYD